MSDNRFAVRPAATGWLVDHSGDAVALHQTRDAAISDATERAMDEHADLVITDAQGRVEQEDRFSGRAPRDGKG